MARTLLGELWHNKEGFAEIRIMAPGSYMVQRFFEWPTEEEDLNDYVRRYTTTHDIYFGVNLRRVRGGTAADVDSDIRWLWADVDKKTGATFASLSAAPLPQPQIIVDSGHGWHLYWALKEPIDHDTAQAVMNDIADMVGGDRVGDPARILRMPGTFNHKAYPPIGVRVIRMKNTRRGYRLGDFDIPKSKVERRRIAGFVGGGRGTRSEDLFRYAIDNVRLGKSDEEIYKGMLEEPAGSKLLEMRTEERRKRWAILTIGKARRTIT